MDEMSTSFFGDEREWTRWRPSREPRHSFKESTTRAAKINAEAQRWLRFGVGEISEFMFDGLPCDLHFGDFFLACLISAQRNLCVAHLVGRFGGAR